jgi:parvulin-like peptidyl-prolyl isomerase
MAKTYSQGSQKAEGGDNGWQELKVINKSLVNAVTNLNPGQCSGVIETPETCFIVLLEERRPAHYTPLNDVRDRIERNLMIDQASRLQKRWIERLKKKTFVTYF